MKKVNALWIPAWYGLDQSIEVGQTKKLFFYKDPPVPIVKNIELYLYSGLDKEFSTMLCEIISIKNNHFGEISKIETSGLSYYFSLASNEVIEINAEENPGEVYSYKKTLPEEEFDCFVSLYVIE